MPPLLYWQAENGRHRRPRRQVPQALRELILPEHTPEITSKGAAKSVAPFAFWLLLLAVILARQTMAAACPADHTGERVHVAYIYDGDTVKLQDGRRVRLIGINTAELEHNGNPRQPLALAARSSLTSMLEANNSTLLLQYGNQQHDHYGRVLAHAFLENGENVAARLLRQGLATTLVVPPNTWGVDCYQELENAARAKGSGLWALDNYQSQDVHSLPPNTRGFRIINGRVTSIHRSRHNIWLDLGNVLTVQVPMKQLANFGAFNFDTLTDQIIEVRGWIRQKQNKPRLTVQHPAALVIISASQQP
jgi:micrococcal nuclease